MTFWFFLLGIPLAALGFTAVFRPSLAAKAMVAFPRNRVAAVVLSIAGVGVVCSCGVGVWLQDASTDTDRTRARRSANIL